MPITPEQARAELARRELAKRQQPAQPQQLATAGMTYPYIPKEEAGRRERAVKATSRGVASMGAAGTNLLRGFLEAETPGAPYAQAQEKGRKETIKKLEDTGQLLWEVSKDPEIAAVGGDTLDKVIDLTFENVPYIAATTGAYALTGPVGGFMVGAAVEGNNARQTSRDFFRQQNQGKDLTPEQEKHAGRIGWGVGIIAGAIEAVGGKGVEKLAQRAISKLNSKMAAGAATFGAGTIIEALEEAGQEITAIGGEETYRDVDWNEAVKRTMSSMAGGAFLGGAFKTMSVAGRGVFSSPAISEPLSQGKITPQRAVEITNEIENKAKELDVTPEYIVGNILWNREADKIISRFPQKIKDQKSLEEIGEGIKNQLGLKNFTTTWKLVTSDPFGQGALGRSNWVTGREGKEGRITIVKPTGELVLEKKEWKGGSWWPEQLTRKKGEALRYTQAYMKRLVVHELGHLVNWPTNIRELSAKHTVGEISTTEWLNKVHQPEFVDWVSNKVYQLFSIEKGKAQPVSEAGVPQVVGPTEQPADIPPGSNVYRGKETGKVYVETPAQMGAKETQVTEEVPSGEGTKLVSKETGEELEFAPDLAVSGRADKPAGAGVQGPIPKLIAGESVQSKKTGEDWTIYSINEDTGNIILNKVNASDVPSNTRILKRKQLDRFYNIPSAAIEQPGAETEPLKTPTPEDELETGEEAEVAEKELEVEAYQEVEPNLYIGNVTGGMRKRMTAGTELKPEDVKGFTEKGWPTKRTKVKLTKGEAEEYLDWLENDLKQRLDENKINTRKDMWMANADWGDIKTLRNALGLDPTTRPFRIIPSQEEGIVYRDRGEIEELRNEIAGLRKRLASYFLKEREAGLTPEQTAERNTVESEILEKKQLVAQLERAKGKSVKIVKDTRSAIYGAVEPSRLQESKMTVGEVLRAVLRRSERYARMAYIGGRKELRAVLRTKARAKKRLDAALKVIKQDIPKSVDIVYRDAIDTIRGQIDPSFRSEAATKRLESLRDFIKRNPEQAKNIPVALLKSLEQTPLNDYTIEQIEELAGSIQKLKDLGGLRRRLETAEYERNKQKDLKKLSEGSTRITERDMRGAAEIGKKLDFNDRLKNKLSRVLNIAAQKKRAITPTDVLVDLMDGGHGTYDGPNFRVFKRTMDRGWGKYLDRLDSIVNDVIKLADKLGLREGNFERIGVYAALQQDNGRQKLLDSKYTEEEIDQVKLSPEELQLYTLMREKLDELTAPIDTIMRDVFNEKLERVKNYFSFMTDFEAMSDYELRDTFSDRVIEYPDTLKKDVKKGFTITRTGGKQKIKINAMEVFLRHADNASYLIELGSDIKRLQEIASTSSYRDAVGDAGQEEMRSWLDLMARKGLVGQDKSVQILDIYRKHVGAAVIGFKLSSALVNTTPLLDGAGLIGRYAFTGASAVATNKQLREFLIKNFPEVRHRMGGDIEFLEFGKSTIEKVERAGFWALQKIDGIANASIVAGAYQKYLDEHGLTFDLDKVNEDARDYAQLIARRTQSSAFFKDLSSAFTRGTFTGNKSIDRLAFQFQSFMLNRWSLIEHDMLRAGIKERDVGKLANMFFWLSMAGFAEMGLRRLSKELIALITGRELDDWSETFTEEIVTNMLQNIPFVSQAMSVYSYGSIPVPSIALANEITNKIKWLRRTNDPDKKLLMSLELLTMTIGTAVGMPGTIQLAEVLHSVGKDSGGGEQSRRPPTRPPARRPPTRRPG